MSIKKRRSMIACLMTLFLSLPLQAQSHRLFDVVAKGDIRTLHSVVDRIRDFSVTSRDGDTLLTACVKGYIAYKRRDAGTTPLHIAAERGDVESVTLLLRAGANPHIWDARDRTPYMVALENRHAEAAAQIHSYLSRKNDDPAEEAYLETATLLLEKGVPVNTLDKDGKSALMYAVEAGFTPLVKLLVNKGADMSFRAGPFEKSLLHTAVERGDIEVIALLARDKHQINAVWDRPSFSDDDSAGSRTEVVERYKKPDDYNLEIIVYSDLTDPDDDRRTYYQVLINRVEQGRTPTGLESQRKQFRTMVEPNRHLIELKQYVLDKKQERYVMLNNIDQPRPGHVYVDVPPERIVQVVVNHVADGTTTYDVSLVRE